MAGVVLKGPLALGEGTRGSSGPKLVPLELLDTTVPQSGFQDGPITGLQSS